MFSDTPGQLLDEAKRKVAITDAVRDKIEGVINVVSFGYHEADEADRDAAIPKKGPRIAKASYLRERQQIEQDLLSEWVPQFDRETAKWVLTVITKADLWWPDRKQVEAHYSEGSYADALEDFKKVHACKPYCAVIEPFDGIQTSGRFGDKMKNELRAELLDCLLRHCDIPR